MPGERPHTNPLTLLLWYTYTCTRDETRWRWWWLCSLQGTWSGHFRARQADRQTGIHRAWIDTEEEQSPTFSAHTCGARQSFENAGANPTLCPMFARPSASAASSSVSARAIPGQLSQGGVCIIIMMATIWGRYEWRVHIHIILLYPPTRCGLSPGLVWEYRRLDGLVDWWWVEEEQAEKINESAAMFLGWWNTSCYGLLLELVYTLRGPNCAPETVWDCRCCCCCCRLLGDEGRYVYSTGYGEYYKTRWPFINVLNLMKISRNQPSLRVTYFILLIKLYDKPN